MCRSFPFMVITLFLLTRLAAASPHLQPSESIELAPTQTFILLDIAQPGRYAIQAKSQQGVALQLVDKLSGPRAMVGVRNEKNGRMDVLLDAGRYKLNVFQPDNPNGPSRIRLDAFTTQRSETLQQRQLYAGELHDLEQHVFHFEVKKRRTVLIEAAGRNLSDMRLWENSDWLIDNAPTMDRSEPRPGQPLTTAHLIADLNPGHYQLKLYGGQALQWSQAAVQHPLHLRMGIPTLPTSSRQNFTTSPFGIDRWRVPSAANYFTLTLPTPGNATLRLNNHTDSDAFSTAGATYTISKKDKIPHIDAEQDSYAHYTSISVQQTPGKTFRLQHFQHSNHFSLRSQNKNYWIGLLQDSSTDAEPPLMSVIYQQSGDNITVIAARMIELTRQQGYKAVFNVDRRNTAEEGRVELFVHVQQAGTYTLRHSGAAATFSLQPFLRKPTSKAPLHWREQKALSLAVGYYVLNVTPQTSGVLKLALQPPSPVRYQTRIESYYPKIYLQHRQQYAIGVNNNTLRRGLVQKSWPLDLTKGLTVHQPDAQIGMMLQTQSTGTIHAMADDTRIPVNVDNHQQAHVKAGLSLLNIAIPQHTTTLHVQFHPSPAKRSPLPTVVMPSLTTAKPLHLTIERNQRKTFTLDIQQDGVYRLESTGLLATQGNVRTPMIPSLWRANQNGIGDNFLLQQYLPAGRYQLTLQAQGQTQGRLAVQLQANALKPLKLQVGRIQRATLAAGQGAMYTLEITQPGTYHFHVTGLHRQYPLRLEDADGWPLRITQATDLRVNLRAGRYHLFAAPQAFTNKILAHVALQRPEARYQGHGPHPIALNQTIAHRWLEPEKNAPRTPDQWVFDISAPTETHITLSEDMLGELTRAAQTQPITIARGGWQGQLQPGRYTLRTTATRSNNQLDYQFTITPTALIPGQHVTLSPPARQTISIAQTGWYQLFSTGGEDVRARLYDSDGQLIAANDDRQDDWNFLIAREFTPGQYQLALSTAGDTPQDDNESTNSSIHLTATATQIEAPITSETPITLQPDGQVHSYPVTLPTPTELLIARVQSRQPVQFSLDRLDQTWTTIANEQSAAATIAYVTQDDSARAYRLRLWADASSTAPITLTLHTLSATNTEPQTLATGVTPTPIATDLNIARVNIAQAVTHHITPTQALFWASPTQRVAQPVTHGTIPVSSNSLWLLQQGQPQTVRGAPQTLSNDRKQRLWVSHESRIKLPPDNAAFRLVQVDAASVQPTILSANTRAQHPRMAVHHNAALRVITPDDADHITIRLANAHATPVHVSIHAFAQLATQTPFNMGPHSTSIAAEQAQSYALPRGDKRIALTLAPGAAAVLLKGSTITQTFWAAQQTAHMTVVSDAEHLLLFNLTTTLSLGHITLTPITADTPHALTLDDAFLQQVITSGQQYRTITLPTPATAYVHVHGPITQALFLGADGAITQGASPMRIQQNGVLILDQTPGPLAVWLTTQPTGLWREKPGAQLTMQPLQPLQLQQATQLHIANVQAEWLYVNTAQPVLLQMRHATHVTTHYLPNGVAHTLLLPKGGTTLNISGFNRSFSALLQRRQQLATAAIEGLNPAVLLAPGQSYWYHFSLSQAQQIGIGLKADRENLQIKLYAASGAQLGTGIVQMHALAAGDYYIELFAPTTQAIQAQLATVGLTAPDNRPPQDVLKTYLSH